MLAGLSEGKALRSSVGTPPWVRSCLPIFTLCSNRQLLYLTLNGREGLRGSSKKDELYGESRWNTRTPYDAETLLTCALTISLIFFKGSG